MRIAVPFPRSRRAAPEGPPRPQRRARAIWIGLGAALLAGAVAAGLLAWRAQSNKNSPALQVPIIRGDLAVQVESSGTVKADQSIELPFGAAGQVSQVLVSMGQQVRAGQALAQLDDHDLRLEVQQAEADLKTASAKLQAAQSGGATPEDRKWAQANLDASLAMLEKTRTGNITTADLRDAAASLSAAKAQLDALEHPSDDKTSAAQLALTQAQASLDRARNELSAAKTNAQIEMEKATTALTQAQSGYATAKQNWEYAQSTGNDPLSPTKAGTNGKTARNKLNDAQRQSYYDAFVRAEAGLRSAEAAVAQAQISYDAARQKESAGVPEAEAVLANAQRQLDTLLHPNANSIAQARATVTQAQSKLDKLRQGGTRADVAGAQASVDEAQASLEKLSAPAAAADLAAAEAELAQAQVKLSAAQQNLKRATLLAPFGGTITSVNITPGALISASTAAVGLINTSGLYIDASLSETDIARIKPGQGVEISFDALPDSTLKGTVESISPSGSASQGVVTYPARIKFEPSESPVLAGMSASISIEVERHTNVLQVPNRAITSIGSLKIIKIMDSKFQMPIPITVETGVTDGASTEIKSCVDTGKQCLREGDQAQVELPSGAGETNGDPGGNTMFSAGPMPAGGPGGGPRVIEIH